MFQDENVTNDSTDTGGLENAPQGSHEMHGTSGEVHGTPVDPKSIVAEVEKLTSSLSDTVAELEKMKSEKTILEQKLKELQLKHDDLEARINEDRARADELAEKVKQITGSL